MLTGHSDEVLHVRWSHSCRMLASVSKDQTCILWKETSRSADSTPSPFSLVTSSTSPAYACHFVLRGHPAPLWLVSWSLDDEMVLCCGSSTEVSVWSTSTGELRLRCDTGHREAVQSCAFVNGDTAFVTASADKSLIMRDLHGVVLHRWTLDLLTDLQVTADQRFIVTAAHTGLMEAIHVKSKRKAALPLFPPPNGSVNGISSANASAQQPMIHPSVAAFDLSDDGTRALVTTTRPAVSTATQPTTYTNTSQRSEWKEKLTSAGLGNWYVGVFLCCVGAADVRPLSSALSPVILVFLVVLVVFPLLLFPCPSVVSFLSRVSSSLPFALPSLSPPSVESSGVRLCPIPLCSPSRLPRQRPLYGSHR